MTAGSAVPSAGGAASRAWILPSTPQVAVPVEEGPVHGGGAGDAGHGDLGAVGGGTVDCGDDALPAACGVGLASFLHRFGPRVCRRGPGWRRGCHARASLAGDGGAVGAVGMPRDTARCLRITVTTSSTSTSTTWADFLRSQADALLACDFFETVTVSGARTYVLVTWNQTRSRRHIMMILFLSVLGFRFPWSRARRHRA